MAKSKPKPKSKGTRRTREHIIASQSQNYIEKFFFDKGHTVDRPTDYGTDLLANTFDEEGYAEAGEIRIQLKAKDHLDLVPDATHAKLRIEVKHYHLWKKEPMPVFLVLYDAQERKAYWLYMQQYFTLNHPKKNARTMTIRVPLENHFTETTVDLMRGKKQIILDQIWGQISHDK